MKSKTKKKTTKANILEKKILELNAYRQDTTILLYQYLRKEIFSCRAWQYEPPENHEKFLTLKFGEATKCLEDLTIYKSTEDSPIYYVKNNYTNYDGNKIIRWLKFGTDVNVLRAYVFVEHTEMFYRYRLFDKNFNRSTDFLNSYFEKGGMYYEK